MKAPNFATGRALSHGPTLPGGKWGQWAQECVPEVTRECLPDGGKRSAFERHM